MAQVNIRAYTHNDLHFLLSSWLRSYFRRSPFTEKIQARTFYEFHEVLIKTILARPTTKAYIAVDKEDPNHIYGFSVFEENNNYKIFHYCYVKKPFRNFKISTELIKHAPFQIDNTVYASHLTFRGEKIIKKYQLIYCPYLV